MPKSIFVQALGTLKTLGAFQVVFPFLLVFAIIFGILDRTKVFGEEASDINGLVAFVIGMLFVGVGSAVGVLKSFVPWVGLLAVFVISMLMIIALFYEDMSKVIEGRAKWVIIPVVLVWLIVSLLYSLGFPGFLGMGNGGGGGGPSPLTPIINFLEVYGPAIALMAFILVFIWLITKGGGEE